MISPSYFNRIPLFVSALINGNQHYWDLDLVRALFNEDDNQLIEGIHLSPALISDALIWKECKSGKFIVRLAYSLTTKLHGFIYIDRSLHDDICKIILTSKTASKVCSFW